MFRQRERQQSLGEHGILGDEQAAELITAVADLRSDVTQLKDRVDSQFTTIAAHAEIAREHSEMARREARADLERTRETLIELIEQVRSETLRPGATGAAGSGPGPSVERQAERLTTTETTLSVLEATVEQCFTRQNELANTMAAFIDTVLAEQRGEPVAGLSLV